MRGTIREAITGALGERIESATAISGGDVSKAYRLELSDRRTVFAKTHADPPPGFFTTEAAGLCWMRDTGTVAVPEVLAVEDDPPYLVLEWIEQGSTTSNDEQDFGRDLAHMHAAGAPVFGRLDSLLGPYEEPALLHGDLWAGNRLVDTSAMSWLIDPACIGGHREFDLAMMRLFGGFGPGVERAYSDTFGPAHGWEERILLHQIAPLVVHAIKFGGPYVRAAGSAIETYL